MGLHWSYYYDNGVPHTNFLDGLSRGKPSLTQIRNSKLQYYILLIGWFYFFIEIIYNTFTVRRVDGKRLVHLKSIVLHYFYSFFVIDLSLFCLITLTICD